jgi:hypothetical protein
MTNYNLKINDENILFDDTNNYDEIFHDDFNNEILIISEIDIFIAKYNIPETVDNQKKTRKEKRKEKLKNMLINPNDIKYNGPLSYRHLRIIAWLTFALGQFLIVSNAATFLVDKPLIGEGWEILIEFVANLATPLFLVATFSIIFKRRQAFRNMILLYAIAFLAISIGFLFCYQRYIVLLLKELELDADNITRILSNKFGGKLQINIFADLLSMTLIHFFINYIPIKYFKGKKIYLFRALVILPLLYLIASYVLIGLDSSNNIYLRIEAYPFLTTKSPLVHLLFITLSLWLKRREKNFLKLGGTKQDYKRFLNTNRNSLAFSIKTSILFTIFSILDFILLIVVTCICFIEGMDIDSGLDFAMSLGFGECTGLFMAIPIILLFSYKKEYKNSAIDIIIPMAGIGLIAFAYIEGIHQILMAVLK